MSSSRSPVFTISDDESSEASSEVEEEEEEGEVEGSLGVPNVNLAMRTPGVGRARLNSESHVLSMARDEQLEARGAEGEGEDGPPGEGAPFRSRSQSAPPALWAAKRYGRQLRRMSDEFDSWLDAGEMRKAAASARQMPHSRTWWSYLFSYPETEAENNVLHPDNNRNQ